MKRWLITLILLTMILTGCSNQDMKRELYDTDIEVESSLVLNAEELEEFEWITFNSEGDDYEIVDLYSDRWYDGNTKYAVSDTLSIINPVFSVDGVDITLPCTIQDLVNAGFCWNGELPYEIELNDFMQFDIRYIEGSNMVAYIDISSAVDGQTSNASNLNNKVSRIGHFMGIGDEVNSTVKYCGFGFGTTLGEVMDILGKPSLIDHNVTVFGKCRTYWIDSDKTLCLWFNYDDTGKELVLVDGLVSVNPDGVSAKIAREIVSAIER